MDSLDEFMQTNELVDLLKQRNINYKSIVNYQNVINKLKDIIKDKLDGAFNNDDNSIAKDVKIGIEKALNSKLDELDSQGIKIIIENMIRKHLGWLIVWGGVFGGLFGLLFSLIQNVI